MTECNRCGDCCVAISLPFAAYDWAAGYWQAPDPRDDESWATRWVVESGWKDEDRQKAINNWLDVHFMAEHWFGIGSDRFSCDAFDPETRLCTAHDERPPVCSGYPWYGKEPKPIPLSFRCSFWRDVPEETWPPRVRVQLARRP